MATISIGVSLSFDDSGACAPCCGPKGIAWSCESRTGTARLYGFSGYSSDEAPYNPSDPWAWEGQMRLWRYRNMTGSMSRWVGGCAPECPGDSASWGNFQEYDTRAEFTQTDGLVYGTMMNSYYDGSGPGGGCTFAGGPNPYSVEQFDWDLFWPFAECPANGTGETSPVRVETTSLITREMHGCGCHSVNMVSWSKTDGYVLEQLDEEQYWYDALEGDPDVEEGDDRCPYTTSANYVTPFGRHWIDANLRAVRVRILVTGCEPIGQMMSVNIELERVDGDDVETLLISTAAPCGVPSFFYVPQPAPGKPGWCVVDVTLASESPA